MALEAIFENGDSLNSKRLLILDGIFLKWALSAIRCDRATPQRELPVNPAVFAHPRTGRTCPLCRENQSDLERASRASLIPCGIWTSAGLRGGHSVWSRDCHSIGVNVIANFEMPASVQVPTRGVTASEAPDQSSQTFGESLLEASKASPAAPMASTSGTTPTTQPEVTSADRLGPNPVLDSRASLPQRSIVMHLRRMTPFSMAMHPRRMPPLSIIIRLRRTPPRIRPWRQSKSRRRRSLIQRSPQSRRRLQRPSQLRILPPLLPCSRQATLERRWQVRPSVLPRLPPNRRRFLPINFNRAAVHFKPF